MKYLLIATLLVLLMPVVMADTAGTYVSVQSSAPTLDNLEIDGQDIGAVVSPVSGQNKTITVEAEVSDANGYSDITGVNCIVSEFAGPQFTALTLSQDSVVDSDTAIWDGDFDMAFHEDPGNYTVTCTVYDSASNSDNKTENFVYDTLVALELDMENVTFGSMQIGVPKTVSGDLDMSTLNASTIQNVGNVRIDASISGTNLTNGVDILSVDNMEFQFDSLGFNFMSSSAQTETSLDLQPAASALESLDLRLTIPQGTSGGSYSGSISVTATQG